MYRDVLLAGLRRFDGDNQRIPDDEITVGCGLHRKKAVKCNLWLWLLFTFTDEFMYSSRLVCLCVYLWAGYSKFVNKFSSNFGHCYSNWNKNSSVRFWRWPRSGHATVPSLFNGQKQCMQWLIIARRVTATRKCNHNVPMAKWAL